MNLSVAKDFLDERENQLVLSLLREVMGSSSSQVTCQVLKRAVDYLVVHIAQAANAPALVMKLAGPKARLACPFEATAALNRMVRSHGAVPTCEVLAAGQISDWRYLVTSEVPGISWDRARAGVAPSELPSLYAGLGQIVAAMHDLRFSSFGEIRLDGTSADEGTYPVALTARATRRILNPAHRDVFHEVVRSHESELAQLTEPLLSHEDLNPGNILIQRQTDGWTITGILDFESAWAGSAHSDLDRLELWKMTGEGFWTGYESQASVPARNTEVIHIHQLLWCLEYAHPTPVHLADTARVCRALGIQPVAFE